MIRYAVVGLGWIAQETVLPAFDNAENSKLTALVSDDSLKLKELGDKYNVQHRFTYDEYEQCLNSGLIDAVYIALPNSMHCEYTMAAAKAGIHVLCEKPMAMSSHECRRMMKAAHNNGIKLMIAYRLHFDEGNLKAVMIARSGKLGNVRYVNSSYSMEIKDDNTRLNKDLAGGPLYDIGIYCINAVRGIFKEEPSAVFAFASQHTDERFHEVPEMVSAILYFSDKRQAAFTCSFGAASTSAYTIVGTQGTLRVDPAYGHNKEVKHTLKIKEVERQESFKAHDQFGPELVYFSKSILSNEDLEPSSQEGLADVRIIEALNESIRKGKAIRLKPFEKRKRPSEAQTIVRKKRPTPELVHAQSPSQH